MARARPELLPEQPEYRAALVLLAAARMGLNVERVMAATRLPRVFVAQCLRRMVDNAVWSDGEIVVSWLAEGPTSEDFWRDVDVALGRRLRRWNEEMHLEWAAPGGWVKHFEYSAPAAGELLHNEYREIEPYDPPPALPVVEEESEPVNQAPRPVQRPAFKPQERRSPAPKVDGQEWNRAVWLG